MNEQSKYYHLDAGFTLLELLVVIFIISLLMAVLMPALGRARDRGRLLGCLANLRGQQQILQEYTVDYEGSLPPRGILNYSTGLRQLINSTLATYSGDPFIDVTNPTSPKVTGIWRCPDAPSEMWTHSGSLFHTPNRWLFNQWTSYDGITYEQTAAAPPGLEAQYGTDVWRKIDMVREPSIIVSLIDNEDFFLPAHNHREAYESIGWSRDVVRDPPDEDTFLAKQGSHTGLFKRNAVCVDGHAETLPWQLPYWFDSTLPHAKDIMTKGQSRFYHREIERFMWMVRAGN